MDKGFPRQGELWMAPRKDGSEMIVAIISKKSYICAKIEKDSDQDGSAHSVKFDWRSAGLKQKSRISLRNIYIFSSEELSRKIGSIPVRERKSVVDSCKQILFGTY